MTGRASTHGNGIAPTGFGVKHGVEIDHALDPAGRDMQRPPYVGHGFSRHVSVFILDRLEDGDKIGLGLSLDENRGQKIEIHFRC
jgi:hypothetical protein